jgi:hypothetical protein
MRMRPLGALALSLALVTGLAACGDDDSEGSSDETTTTTESSGDETTTTAGDGGEDVDVDDVFTGDCAEIGQSFSEAAAGIGTGADPSEIGDLYGAVADATDGEVSEAWRTFGDAIESVFQELEDQGIDLSDPNAFSDPEVAQQVGTAFAAMSSEELTAASTTIQEWIAGGCEGL